MALPDFRAPGGWYDAMAKEVKRVESFAAWRLVPISEYHKARRDLGDDNANVAYIVTAQTIKTDADGSLRSLGVANKFRITLADKCHLTVDSIETYSCCVDDITNRLMTLLAPMLGAEQTTIDISAAYFHGLPSLLRRLFSVVPWWLKFFGDYPERDAQGRRSLLEIVGNMPGRRDAGRIWQTRLDGFLLSYGMRQLITDRRV